MKLPPTPGESYGLVWEATMQPGNEGKAGASAKLKTKSCAVPRMMGNVASDDGVARRKDRFLAQITSIDAAT